MSIVTTSLQYNMQSQANKALNKNCNYEALQYRAVKLCLLTCMVPLCSDTKSKLLTSEIGKPSISAYKPKHNVCVWVCEYIGWTIPLHRYMFVHIKCVYMHVCVCEYVSILDEPFHCINICSCISSVCVCMYVCVCACVWIWTIVHCINIYLCIS